MRTRSRLPVQLVLLALPTLLVMHDAPTPPSDLIRRLKTAAVAAPIVVGHRGDSGEYPENTLEAFTAALDAGATVVELDFHQTADGVLVCLHDATLDRTTDARTVLGGQRIAVASRTFADLQRLDAGRWKAKRFAGIRVPTLAAALDCIQPRAITMIEHKAGKAEDLVALLREKRLVANVIVQSFDWDWLATVHRLEPKLTIAALSDDPVTPARLDDVARTGASILHWDHRILTVDDIAEMRRRGFLTCVYTVDADVALIGCARAGLDLVTTNRPGRLVALIAAGHAKRR